MGRIRLGIYDKETGYARNLAAYLRKRCEDNFEIKIFTRIDALENCLGENGLDLILAGMEAETLCRKYKEVPAAILLEENGTDKEFFGINKYQSAEEIWKKLLLFAGDRINGSLFRQVSSGKTEFLGIASPVHGCGKTSIGLMMSRILGEREENKVLFLSLDEFSVLSFMIGGEQVGLELSELFYYYSQGELLDTRLQAAVSRWGKTDYILPVKIPEDLYSGGKPYEAEFFRCLAEKGGYGQVVLDLGNSISGKEDILRLCSRIYVPARETAADEARVQMFLKWMEVLEIEKRVVVLRIPEFQGKVWDRYISMDYEQFRWFKSIAEGALERSGYGMDCGK